MLPISKNSVSLHQPATPVVANQRPSFTIGNGYITTNLGSNELGNAVAVQADGKIVVPGVISEGPYFSYYLLTRYNIDGSLDLNFGNNGTLKTSATANPAELTTLITQTDGTIIFGGSSLLRANKDGQLDAGFIGKSFAGSVIYHVTTQTDGKFVLTGFKKNADPNSDQYDFNSTIERLNKDGSLDLTFNQTGIAEFNLGKVDTAHVAVVQSNNKIVFTSYLDGVAALLRLNTNGSLDTSYGNNGKVIFTGINPNTPSSDANALVIQSDGKLLMTGSSYEAAYIARYNENGTLDTTFNGIGYAKLSVPGVFLKTSSIKLQADGKIIIAGQASMYEKSFFAARFNSDGSIDTSFNQTGILQLTNGFSGATGIDIQEDGKIVFSSTKDLDLALVRVNPNGTLDKALNVSSTVNDVVNFTGGGNPVILDKDAKVYDADFESSNNYANSSLTLERLGGANAQDVFTGSGSLKLENGSIIIQNKNIGSYKLQLGQLQMTFNSNATQELISASMQQISYKNTNNHLTQNISINWKFDDGSATANSSVTATSMVNVLASPNTNAPTTADNAIIGLEDEAYAFKMSDFIFKDSDVADSLQSVIITGLPTVGSLYTKGINGAGIKALDIADTISISDILAGKLLFLGASNANGSNYSSFRVKVSDGADSSSSATITIHLTPTNDLPTGTTSISGKFSVGQTLTATNNLVDIDGIGAISYQWKANGFTIDGATNSNLVLSEKEAGKTISVVAQYIDGGGTREAVSSLASKAVGKMFIGTEKNDQFASQYEDETFNGAVGKDTVSYSNKLSAYTIKNKGSHFEVSSKSGVDGIDTLINIETLQFSDINLNLEIQSKAAGSSNADIAQLIELYIAFFNRIPDANGLSYWISEMQSGQKISQIAESFFKAGTMYTSLTGYSVNMSDADFINTIYKNTLGRAGGADADGLKYWQGELASGRASHGSLAIAILNSAHDSKGNTQWGFVADLLDNKIAVGKTIAVDWGISFNSDTESVLKGMAIAAAVTATSTSAAIELIGINSQDISLY